MSKETIYEWEARNEQGGLIAEDFTSSDKPIGAAARVIKHPLQNNLVPEYEVVAIDIGEKRFMFYGFLEPQAMWVDTMPRPRDAGRIPA